MRKSHRAIVIAARRSLLARRQAELVGTALGRLNPHVSVQYRWLESEADHYPDQPLDRIPRSPAAPNHPDGPKTDVGIGKGLFTKTIEQAIMNGTADIAVHSLKDLPVAQVGEGLILATIPSRADVRDCLICREGITSIESLPQGATVGTASPRRIAQIRRLRSDLSPRFIRGNIDTRLRKVKDGQYDATILSVAGLRRADLSHHVTNPISLSNMLPAAGQGALAVQCRSDDHVTIQRCLPINNPVTAAAVHAERDVVGELGCDCHSPIAVLAEPIGDHGSEGFHLWARILSLDGTTCLEAQEHASPSELGKLTKRVVSNLISQGARSLLAETANSQVPLNS